VTTSIPAVLRAGGFDSDDDTNAGDLQMGLDAFTEADSAYEIAEEYYEDRRPEVFASTRLRRAMARTSTSFKFGFAKKVVDAITDRLEISSITSTDESAKAAIEDLIRDNKLYRQFKNWFRRAGEYGDAYVIAWPAPKAGTPDGQLADTDDDGITNVDIFYNSPRTCRMIYDPENPNRKLFLIKKWVLAGQKRIRVNLYYPDRLEKYVSDAGVLHPKASDLRRYYDDDNLVDPDDPSSDTQWPVPNPFGEIPGFHFRTDDPYGCPEHAGFYGSQDTIRKLVLGHMASVDYQSFPQRWALADGETDGTELEADDEDMAEFALEDTGGTRNRGGEPRAQLDADPASVWLLRGYKGVGQFDAADPAKFTDPMTLYLRFGAMITDTPVNRIDPTGAAESGESRRVAEGPFSAKIEDRQARYGDTIVELFEFILNKILGFPDVQVTVHWKSAKTVDDQEGWQTLLLKLQAGLPAAQAFLEAGYTEDQVKEWFGDGDEDLPIQVDLLLKIAQALAAFAPALGSNVVSEEQVQEIIAAVMGEWTDDPEGFNADAPRVPAPAPPVPAGVTGDDPNPA
jgi:hypothetical protein